MKYLIIVLIIFYKDIKINLSEIIIDITKVIGYIIGKIIKLKKKIYGKTKH